MVENTAPSADAPRRPGRPVGYTTKSVAPSVGPPTVDAPMIAPRPDMRAAMREDDPRARAAKRAAEIREHIGELDEGIDEFAAPEAPEGWVYNWKRNTVHNQPDPSYNAALARRGWEPVPAARHPEMVSIEDRDGAVMRKGMVLMERPKTINDEAKVAELNKARKEVRNKEVQLGQGRPGEFERKKPSINRQYEPMQIPDDI